MIRFRRIRVPHRVSTVGGAEAVLLAEMWRIAIATRWLTAGWSYTRPLRVERPGEPPVAVRDHVMIARLAAVAVTAAVWLLMRRRDR